MEAKAEKKTDQVGLLENGGMDPLEYVEVRTEKTMAVLRHAYDDLHERAYKLATVLVAGAGGAGAYALGKIGGTGGAIAWAPLAALALSWLGVAACLVWRGATARDLSPGNGPKNLLGYYDERLAALQDAGQAMEQTRRAELGLQQKRMGEYEAGCIERADALDLAYKSAAVCSALVPVVVAGACLLLR